MNKQKLATKNRTTKKTTNNLEDKLIMRRKAETAESG